MTPRCGPKKVLWVEPVTISAPSAKGFWKWSPMRPSTWAMSYMMVVGIFCSSTNWRMAATGSLCSTMLLPKMISSGR